MGAAIGLIPLSSTFSNLNSRQSSTERNSRARRIARPQRATQFETFEPRGNLWFARQVRARHLNATTGFDGQRLAVGELYLQSAIECVDPLRERAG